MELGPKRPFILFPKSKVPRPLTRQPNSSESMAGHGPERAVEGRGRAPFPQHDRVLKVLLKVF